MKDLRDTLDQYHASVDLVPEAEWSLFKYKRSVLDKVEVVVAGNKHTKEFELAQMDVSSC